jgi:hypothetical protein
LGRTDLYMAPRERIFATRLSKIATVAKKSQLPGAQMERV